MRKDERKGAIALIVAICILLVMLWWCGRRDGGGDTIDRIKLETLQNDRNYQGSLDSLSGTDTGLEGKGRRLKSKSGKKGSKKRGTRRKGENVKYKESVRDILADTINTDL